MKFIDVDNSWGKGILYDWYIHSVSPMDKPQWTEEHIEELCNDFYVIPKETTQYDIDCNFDRLKELSEADKDGRCLVLPCKVGDKAFVLMKDIPTSIEETVCSNMYMVIQAPFPYDEDIDMFLKIKDFGKTVFLTKEEAERALEERK